MGSPRRKHSREFKLEAVKQVVQQGRSVSEVADGLGINRNMLTRWKTQFEEEALWRSRVTAVAPRRRPRRRSAG